MRLATTLALALSIALPAAASANSWLVRNSTDRMSGKVTKYLYSDSKNILQGWHRSGKLLLGYTCGDQIYVRANNIGFHVDGSGSIYGCRRLQYARVKFDNEPPKHVQFCVWRDNRDGMSFEGRRYSSLDLSQEQILQKMKTSKVMLVEVTLFNTKGKKQIAEFDLTGFTVAFNQCKQ